MRMNLGRRDGIYVDGGLLKNLPGDAFAQKNMDGSFNTLEAKFDLNRVGDDTLRNEGQITTVSARCGHCYM